MFQRIDKVVDISILLIPDLEKRGESVVTCVECGCNLHGQVLVLDKVVRKYQMIPTFNWETFVLHVRAPGQDRHNLDVQVFYDLL